MYRSLNTKPKARRIAIFLRIIEEEELASMMIIKNKLDAVQAAFQNYCTPKANETIETYSSYA